MVFDFCANQRVWTVKFDVKKGLKTLAAFAFYQNFSDAPKGEKSRFLNTLRIQDLKGP